ARARSHSSTTISRRSTSSRSSPPSLPRSTASPSRVESICGRGRAPRNRERPRAAGEKLGPEVAMRVAVTGGSGKLGRAVVDELLAHEDEVVNLDRGRSADPRAALTRGGLTDPGPPLHALPTIAGRHEGVRCVGPRAAL